MVVCVYHPRFGRHIAEVLSKALPEHDVFGVTDTTRDPPRAAEIEVLVANRFPAGMLARLPRLEWLQLTSVGVDHVLPEPRADDLVITNAGSVPAAAVAEFTWMGILALAKDARALADAQRRHAWEMPKARRLLGATMTVLGLGRIGSEVAARARAFGVRVLAVRRHPRPSTVAERVVGLEGLDDALAESSIVVNALPDSATTRRLLDARRLSLLPHGSLLVSIGRASVIDRDALVSMLRSGRLGGALVDVHDVEPLPPEDPIWDAPSLWVTPHCAYEYPEQKDDLASLCLENISRRQTGLPLLNLMDDETKRASSLANPSAVAKRNA